MPKVTFDGTALRVVVNSGITSLDVEADLYSDWKEWVLTGANSQYATAFRTTGGDPLPGSLELGAVFFLQNQSGWRVRPQEANHELILTGNLYPEDGARAMFVPTLGSYTVAIQIERSSLTQGVVPKGGVIKATALPNFSFVMVDSADHASPKAGLTVTAQRSRDGGAFASTDNAPVEVGNGVYKVSLTANDLTADIVVLRFAAAEADDRLVTIVTDQ